MRKRWMGIGVICWISMVIVLCSALFTNNVNAKAVSSDSLYKLSVLRGVRQCYNLYAKERINEEDYKDYLSVFHTDKGDFEKTGASDIWITTHVGNNQSGMSNENDSNMSCQQILEGYGSSMKGLKSYYPGIEAATLETMGYKRVGESASSASKYGEDKRVLVTINPNNIKNGSDSTEVNLTVEGGGIECFAGGTKETGLLFWKRTVWSELTCSGKIIVKYNGKEYFAIEINGTTATVRSALGDGAQLAWGGDQFTALLGGLIANGSLVDDFKNGAFNRYLVEDLQTVMGNSPFGYTSPSITIDYSNDFAEKTGQYGPVGNALVGAAGAMLYNVGVDSSLPNTTSRTDGEHNTVVYSWNGDYTYGLYYRYLQDAMEKYPEISINTCSESKSSDGGYYFKNTPTQWCRVQIPGGSEGVLNEVYSIVSGNDLGKGTFKQVLEWLSNEKSYSGVSNEAYANSRMDNNGNLVVEEGEEDNCRNVSGAKGLGWILCPILEWMGGAATGLYDGVVEPLLSIDPKLFNNNETNNTTEEAWETFRNIANVIFIILFLVVIFSQLTGVGIDNYGIKKILPRLIVAAVMINLSYILCILLVDISNILGSGLRGIFEVLGNDINPTISMDGVVFADGNTTTTVAGAIAGVSLFGLLAGGIGVAIFGGAATLLSLFVSGIGVIISIVFMFLLLSVREAAIVVLVVISPLVVVAYMLPNTKKLFDKWWKLFEGLLLVYPIAGMLVGAGNYASKLLLALNPNDFFSWITAMVVGIVPIFFIPMVLKGAFSAMGKVGGMLTGLGGMASKKATGTVRSSDAYKNAQNRMRAGLDRNGNLTRFGKLKTGMIDKLGKSGLSKVPGLGGAVTGLSKSQAAKIEQAKKSIAASEAATGVLAGALATTGISKAKTVKLEDGGELTQEGSYYADSFFDAARRNDITGMNAAIEAMRNSNMKAKDISRVIRHAQNKQMFNGIDSDKRSAWYRDLSKKYGNDFLSTDYELSHFMRTGGSLNGGQLGDYGEYAKSAPINSDEIRPEDLTKMSGDSLAAMIASGKITQGMAQRVMAMNPNISEDKKIMLGAVANGAATAKFDVEGNELEGGTITSYKQFKDDVKALMGNHAAETKTIKTSSQDVEAWTGATPRDVRIVGGNTASSQTQLNVQPQRVSTPVSTPTSTITSSTGGSDGGTGVGGSDGAGHSVDYDFTGMSDDSVLDIATAPKVAMNNPVREAAEREYNVRVQSQSQSQLQSVNPQDVRIRREAGRMPRTESGIVLPGDTSQISKLAEQARKSNNNNNRQ